MDREKEREEALQVLEETNPESDLYKYHVAELLNRIDPQKPFGTDLYNAIARLSWNMAFEAVALRVNKSGDGLEVYLRQRAMDDTAYPGEWHAPGSVRRPGESWRKVADRLAKEFGAPIVSYQEIGRVDKGEGGEARGSFESTVFIVELASAPREDERHRWFAVDNLPQVTVDSHEDYIIPMAVLAMASKTKMSFHLGARIVSKK